MKVVMRVAVSGTRGGQDWPPPGAPLEVSDEEGAQLCAAGLAEPVPQHTAAEVSAPPKAEERAAPAKKAPTKATGAK